MKTLYLDCSMGAAGDMLTAALLDMAPNKESIVKKLNALRLPGVEYVLEKTQKCGIAGSFVRVMIHGKEEECENHSEHGHDHAKHSHEHHHHTVEDIEKIVREQLNASDKVKEDTLNVFSLIAEAESSVHGKTLEEIHFHEVGTMDAIADVSAVALLMEEIAPEQVVSSPVNTGSGTVKCAHGVLPVPAPATAYILKGVPMYQGEIKSELCTPTGAALIKYYSTSFGNMPVMQTHAIGYGMGKKDFGTANCLRALLGETQSTTGSVSELCCNIDDMTAEAIGFAMDMFLSEGALEVYTVGVGMKKNRPGTLLCVMCKTCDRDKMVGLIFKHTTTLGVRENVSRRYTLDRRIEKMQTYYGEVRRKISVGYGVEREKLEYDDISRIAKENGMSLREVTQKLTEEEKQL